MKRTAYIVLAFAVVVLCSLRVFADGPGPKNLQVLPKTTTKEQLKIIMKEQSKALGVECDFCHDVPDMASDANEHKKIARQMMKMTEEINAKWIKGTIKSPEKHPVLCVTCHQGKADIP